MEKRRLGGSELLITPIGFGGWAIGGYGWGPQDDGDSIAAIHRALHHGINWIDTAAVYGLGHSEEVVAQALRGRSERPYVFTKCSLVWDERRRVSNVLKAESIRREVEGSLRRLRTDTIDLYQIHWPIPDEDIEEGWTTLADLRKEGKVRHIGVSNFDVGQMRRAQAIAPVISLQPPYSLIRREIEGGILQYAREQGIGVIVWSPMASGLLSGTVTPERMRDLPEDDWRRKNPEFQEPRLSRHMKLVALLRAIGERRGRSPGEVAVAWTLRNPAVTGAIVGLRRAEQVDGIVGAAHLQLDDGEMAEIESLHGRLYSDTAGA